MRSVHLRGDAAPRNPRLYRKRVRRADPGIRPGEVVAVRTESGHFVGRAFYSPRAAIALRILDRQEDGPPVDAAWFAGRVERAVALRREVLRLDAVADAWRAVHAEGDGLSAVVVDRYADAAVIEVGSRGMFEHLHELEEVVARALGARRVVVRADPAAEEGFEVRDRRTPEVRVVVSEHGLQYVVDCSGGHKTGFFVDQRESRLAVLEAARARRVIDLCCYTGGFALAAARGGARSVVAVDLDEEAVALARQNARRNGLQVAFEHADAFDFLRSGPRADLVVLDPPKLAARRADLPRARRKSIDLNALAMAALESGGLLFTFSCTGLFAPDEFLAQVREAAIRAGRELRLLRVTGQPPDHPVDLHCPETRYLTGLVLQAR